MGQKNVFNVLNLDSQNDQILNHLISTDCSAFPHVLFSLYIAPGQTHETDAQKINKPSPKVVS